MKKMLLMFTLMGSIATFANENQLSKVKLILANPPRQSEVTSAGQKSVHRDWHVAYNEFSNEYYATSTDYLLAYISVKNECPFQEFFFEDLVSSDVEEAALADFDDYETIYNVCHDKQDFHYKFFEDYYLENNIVIAGTSSGHVYSIGDHNTDSGICSAGYTKLKYVANISEQLEISITEAAKLYEQVMQSK